MDSAASRLVSPQLSPPGPRVPESISGISVISGATPALGGSLIRRNGPVWALLVRILAVGFASPFTGGAVRFGHGYQGNGSGSSSVTSGLELSCNWYCCAVECFVCGRRLVGSSTCAR